jgi:RimJ/RimL family protein N-acetyltransferase
VRRPPPYRIETERLVIRCWEPRDAPLLKEAIDSSMQHLGPWLPWIGHEPQTVDEKVELLRTFRGRFDLGENFNYATFDADGTRVLGGCGFHPRTGDDASIEIGYWIRASAARQGLTAESAAVLTRVAIELCGWLRVEIRIDPANAASLGVPRKLGYTEEATLRGRLDPHREGDPRRDVTVFSMFPGDLEGSACARARYTAYDAAGRVVGSA